MSEQDDKARKAAEEWAHNNNASQFGISICPTTGAEAGFLAGVAWARKNPGWIRCDERMPSEREQVWRYSPSRGSGIDYLEYVTTEGKARFWGDEEFNCYDATHWIGVVTSPRRKRIV